MKTNEELIEYCESLLNKKTVYVLGEFGRELNATTLNQKCRQYSFNQKRRDKYLKLVGKGYHAYDCIGLLKSFLWFDEKGNIKYNSNQDVNEAMLLNKSKIKGKIDTLPKVKGVAVFMKGHVGYFDGIDSVYECTASNALAKKEHGLGGVCKTKLTDRVWTDWAYIPYIEYKIETHSVNDNERKTIQEGDRIKIKMSATLYANSTASIPLWVKKRSHTVLDVRDNKVRLKEINSWVYIKDIERA